MQCVNNINFEKIDSYPLIDDSYSIYSSDEILARLDICYKKEAILANLHIYNSNVTHDLLDTIYTFLCENYSEYRYIEIINFNAINLATSLYLFQNNNVYYCLNKAYKLQR